MSYINNPQVSSVHFNRFNLSQQAITSQRNDNFSNTGFISLKNDNSSTNNQNYASQRPATQSFSTGKTSKYTKKYSFKKHKNQQYSKASQVIYEFVASPQWSQRPVSHHPTVTTKNSSAVFKQPQIARHVKIKYSEPKDNSNKFIQQIKQLKANIQIFQQEKLEERSRLRYLEQSDATYSKNAKQTLKEIQKLRAKIKEMSLQYGINTNQLNIQIQNLKQNNSKYLKYIDMIQRQKTTYVQLANQKLQQKTGLQYKYQVNQLQKQKYIKQLNQKSQQIKKLQRKISYQQTENQNYASVLIQKSQENRELYRKFELLKLQKQKHVDLFNQKLQENNQLYDKLQCLQKQKQKYASYLNQQSQEIISLQHRLHDLQVENQQYAKSLNQQIQTSNELSNKLYNMEIQKQQYVESLNAKQLQNTYLLRELEDIKNYLRQLQNQKLVHRSSQKAEEVVQTQKYDEIFIKYGQRYMQAIVAVSQIDRLNVVLLQNQKYLKKAQQYIIQLEESLQRKETELSYFGSNKNNNQGIQDKLAQSDNQIRELNLQIYQLNTKLKEWEAKYQLLLRENEQMKYKLNLSQLDLKQIGYLQSKLQIAEKTINQFELQNRQLNIFGEQLQKKNKNLAKQRDEFLMKISSLLSELQYKVEGPVPQQDDDRLQTLEAHIKNIQSELQTTVQQLKKAEKFIQQNLQNWKRLATIQTQYLQKQQQINGLTNDLQLLKIQNEELVQKLKTEKIDIEEEYNVIKQQNYKLQSVIQKYKLTQIQSQAEYDKILQILAQAETQLKSCNGQQEQQQELNRLRGEIQTLRNQTDVMKAQIDRLSQVQEAIKKAEAYIFNQLQPSIKEYKAQNAFLKDHLQRAETYIKDLESRTRAETYNSEA